MMEAKQNQSVLSMDIINPHAAGVDIGSRSHWVSIGQSEKEIREFGVFNDDLYDIAKWLKENNIKSIAMESTGTYWQSLYAVYIKACVMAS
ncbi:MAG: transposase [Saprospiraceae bacterium]|nr:transposase [Saprospiraceae bacterium]